MVGLLLLLRHLLGAVDCVERFCLTHQLDSQGFVKNLARCRATVLGHMMGRILRLNGAVGVEQLIARLGLIKHATTILLS